MNCKNSFVKILVIMTVFLSCESRGGRRGGSFGGLFGSWRKYKKPSSGGGNSRRIISSSPVHTPITKAWHDNKKTSNSENFQKYGKTSNLYNGYNTPLIPTGGSYYQGTASLPGNAIYVAQAPPRGAEFGDFLTGYLTGRLLTMGMSSPHYHVTHVYKENTAPSENAVNYNSTSQVFLDNDLREMSTEKIFNAPLIEFETTTTDSINIREVRSTTTQIPSSSSESPAPPYGIICIPMLVSETNSNGEEVQNEKTVCYPAPAPITTPEKIKSKPVEIAGDITEH